MDQLEKIEFVVDEQYENEKGIFTVISIHRDQMVIRWESGEEIRTDIDLQRRIAERRQWEEHVRKTAAEAAAKKSAKSAAARKKSVFAGFAPTDFKKSASGTTWRSRNQLGSAVAQKIDSTRFKFNTWAFGHKPEMHVQDPKHRGKTATDDQARFFVRLDPQTICYGFRVARPAQNDDASTDWEDFTQWLTQPDNENTLRSLAAKEKLTVRNLATPDAGPLLASDDGWRTDESKKKPDIDTLSAYIAGTPNKEPFDLEIAATTEKNDALESGKDIAADVAKLFTQLLPLYEGAVTGGGAER